MKRSIAPFLTPPDSAVSHGGWILKSPSGDVALPADLPHWDYQTVLELAAPVSIDRQSVTQSCDLAFGAGLAVLVMARSDHTKHEEVAARMELPLNDTFDLAIDLRLLGHTLGGRLTLETLLVVTRPEPLSPLAPQRAGSVIWRGSHWTNLEGIGSQFPTETLDFGELGRDVGAGWALHVDLTHPDARFMSAARLSLNSGNPAIMRLLDGGRDAASDQLLRTLNWDVMRQMAFLAIKSDDVVDRVHDPDDISVAGVLRALLHRLWPLESPLTLRLWARDEPARLEMHIQHHAGLLP